MGGAEGPEAPIRLFYSYSHRDEAFRGELEAHLSFLRRSKLIAEWHDRMIGAGDDWKGQIDRRLAEADIILLLVSADFIASDYCWGEEMTKALARHQLGDARVIPVILRPCRWQKTPLGKLQAVPKDGKPVSEWPNHDAAFNEIAAAIERTIDNLQQQRRRAGEQPQQRAEEERQLEAQERREQESPPPTIRIFTLGPDTFGFFSWTVDREKAREKWDIFWTTNVEHVGAKQNMKSADYQRVYDKLKSLSSHAQVGLEQPDRQERKHESVTSSILERLIQKELNINDLMISTFTTFFDHFDDDGIAYKEIDRRQLKNYFTTLPTVRKF